MKLGDKQQKPMIKTGSLISDTRHKSTSCFPLLFSFLFFSVFTVSLSLSLSLLVPRDFAGNND